MISKTPTTSTKQKLSTKQQQNLNARLSSLYRLLDLVSHDLAIEDTFYFLAKALDRERIDPASYLKVVRSLAREQFFKKALAAKIREELHMAT